MSLSSTGRASANARTSRHIRAKVRCEDVKVEPAGSMRRIAVLIGAIAAPGYSRLV